MKPPRVVARFVSGPDGSPEVFDRGGVKNYKIELLVENAPKEAYGVTYALHDSYYDPIREVLGKPSEKFPEEITSYGDYRVRAQVRSSKQSIPVSAKLSDALRDYYADKAPDAVAKAIRAITKN